MTIVAGDEELSDAEAARRYRQERAARSSAGRAGGKARAAKLSPRRRKAQASKAARARAQSMTPAQRSAAARRAAAARWHPLGDTSP